MVQTTYKYMHNCAHLCESNVSYCTWTIYCRYTPMGECTWLCITSPCAPLPLSSPWWSLNTQTSSKSTRYSGRITDYTWCLSTCNRTCMSWWNSGRTGGVLLYTVMSHTHIPPTCAFSVLHRPPWSLLLSLKATLISRAHGQKYSLPDTASSHLYASTWLVGDTVGIMVPSPPQPWSLFCLCGLLLLQL